MSTDVPFDAFSMNDVDVEELGKAGSQKLPQGGYCMMIVEVIVQNKKGATEILCEVLAAENKSLIGHPHREFLKWPQPEYQDIGKQIAKRHLVDWCYAAGTISLEEIQTRQLAGERFDVGWLEAMVGQSVLVFVKAGIYNDLPTAKIEGRVWALDNPKAKGIPGWVESATPTETPPQQPASPQQPPQQPETAADPFADLAS